MTWTRWLARWRVTLGFVGAALVFGMARPTPLTLVVGAAIALVGEGIRVWAAGHLEKSREVTASGPYRYTRHPLYLGSTLIGIGFAIASASPLVLLLATLYLGTTIPAAIRAEEAHLRDKFGGAYDRYASGRGTPVARRFSWHRALGNREHHALAGFVAAVVLLLIKALYTA